MNCPNLDRPSNYREVSKWMEERLRSIGWVKIDTTEYWGWFKVNDRGGVVATDKDPEFAVVHDLLKKEETRLGEGEPRVVQCERWPTLDNWKTIVEVHPEPFRPGERTLPPAVVVRQHRETKELRIDVYDCKDGLDVTYTNGGVGDESKKRARWFRDIRISRSELRPIRVRFMASGEASNLELKS